MKTNKTQHIESSGFKTPTDYFETFDDKIFEKLQNDMTPIQINKTGFEVPKDYFESVENTILNKVKNTTTETKVIPLFSKKTLLFVSSIAAAVAILFSVSVFESKPSFDSLDTETLNSYVLNENFSAIDMASLFTDNELNTNTISDQYLEDEHLEDYILNHIDLETLITE